MFDINILVNGSRCKQYQHEGKTFIQANPGSEYVIEIKNNFYKRILAVSSVDGLDVLDGEKASADDDDGYIIDGYHSEKIKGFRLSDDEWALFKFGYKFSGKTYAQSKGDDSDKNCGVIGVRIYYEYEPITYTINTYPNYLTPTWNPSWPYTTGGDSSYWTSTGNSNSSISNTQYTCKVENDLNNPIRACNLKNSGDNSAGQVGPTVNFLSTNSGDAACAGMGSAQNPIIIDTQPKGFDVGTEFGRKETSKIQTVKFVKGFLAHSLDIYYASRESLIEMGVPLTNQLKVALPQSFPGKYCVPPTGWQG